MRHLFIIDPLERLLPDADTTIVFMREAQKRGYEVATCEVTDIGLDRGVPYAACQRVSLRAPGNEPWFERDGERTRAVLSEFDAVWMRKDPPFDMDFFYVTHLLSMIDGKTVVVNDPAALRDANEKLFALRFAEYCPDTLVSRDMAEITAFRDSLGGECVVKPLDGAGGEGVFHLAPGDRNVGAILESSTAHGTRYLMAQRYVPEIRTGDKRIILVEGEPLGAVLRVPTDEDARANFHAGGAAAKTEITAREREISAAMAPMLRSMGIVFAGIDVIGDWLTEVNVTSPTGIREIARLDGVHLEEAVMDAVETRVRERQRS